MTAPAAECMPVNTLRVAVVRGVRWTVWLAALSLPCSFGTRILLARYGPDALAAYGLLLVYLNFVAAFPFVGGNAVVIRYMPSLAPALRRGFLLAYAGVIAALWLPWVAVAAWAPSWLGWLFGSVGGPRFRLVMVALAPLPIAFSLALAALKGVLELTWAQWIYRVVTLGMLVCAAGLVLVRTAPTAFVAYWIWGGYLLLAALATLAAWVRLRRYCPRGGARWYLPRGFPGYTAGLQAASMVGFFAGQLDVLLVLHHGGFSVLGAYVAILSLTTLGVAGLKLLLDGFMSALTNAGAAASEHGADPGAAVPQARVWLSYSRLLLPLIAAFGALLALLAHPLLALYGPQYVALAGALRWLAPGAALYALDCVIGTTLAALGRPQDEVKAKLLRIAAFLLLFGPLWRSWGITGAALAWSGAEIPYHAANLWYLRRRAPFPLRWHRIYPVWAGTILTAVTLGSLVAAGGIVLQLATWLLLMLVFLAAAGYHRVELRGQMRLLLPGAVREDWI